MKHLSNEAIVDAAEGGTAFAEHLSSCEPCRARVAELRAIVGNARGVEVPEPSPLFWDHFSARVREAVAAEPQPDRAWSPRFAFGWATGAAAVAIIVIGFVVTMRTGQPAPSATATSGQVLDSETRPSEAVVESVDSIADADTWALMGELASQIEWEDATEAGLMSAPGSADRVMDELSSDERRVVVELLEQEIQKSKSL